MSSNRQIKSEAVYHFGVPEELVSTLNKPKFHIDYKKTNGSMQGNKLIDMGIYTADDFFELAPIDFEIGQTYQLWEQNGKDYEMLQAEYIAGDLPKEVDTSRFDQEFNSLKDEIRQMNSRESNVSNSTFDTLNNIIRERDSTIGNLYKELNNIHVEYNKQIQDKNNEINEVKAQLAAKTLEFERYKEQKDFEERIKTEHQKNLEKIERELNGKITALNDDLDAANQDDLLDKASELAKNPIVEKFLTMGAAFLEQQMSPQRPPVAPQMPYNNYQQQQTPQFTEADLTTPKFVPVDSFKNGVTNDN